MTGLSHSASQDRPTTVVFMDFDGTVTRGDSLLPFLRRLTPSRLAMGQSVAMVGVDLLRTRRASRSDAKQFLVSRCVSGRGAEDLRGCGREFAQYLAQRRVLVDAMSEVDRHRTDGALVVLVSASLDVYLEPFRDLVGLDALLCTQMEYRCGVATGRFSGPNVRGAEKVRMVEGWMQSRGLERDHCEVVAYGNGAGDRHLLNWADCGFLRSRRFFRRTGGFRRVPSSEKSL